MGSGFKTFASAEVLTAANVNNYLMEQAVMSFADATARDAALTSPEEGMVAYLQDVNSVTVYSGSAWVTIADLDVLAVDSANGRVDVTGDVRLNASGNDFEVTTDGSNFYGLGKYYQASGAVSIGSTTAFTDVAKVTVPKGRWLVMATGRIEFAIASAGRTFEWRIGNITSSSFVDDAYLPKATAFGTGTHIPMSASGVIETTGSQDVGIQASNSVTGGTVQARAHLQVIGVH